MSSETPAPNLDQVQRWMLAVITHPQGVGAGAGTDEARRWLGAEAGGIEDVVTDRKSVV